MTRLFLAPPNRLCLVVPLLALLGGCSALSPTATPQPFFYSLDNVRLEAPVTTKTTATQSVSRPTLIVNPPHAASGFDSKHIIYIRKAHTLEYYAHSEWNDTPARMIAPLIVAAVENSGAFRAVVRTPSAAAGDLRLDTEIIRLQLDTVSTPSQVRFTLRAYLVNNSSRDVLAWREFDETVAVTSEDPYGSVVAANHAVQNALGKLAGFCAEATALWPSAGIDHK